MKKLLIFAALVVAGSTLASAQDAPGARRVDTVALYLKYCANCHGPRGEGKGDVRPLTGTLTHGSAVSDIETVLRDGVKDTTMTPFKGKMTAAQLKSLAEFIRDMAPR